MDEGRLSPSLRRQGGFLAEGVAQAENTQILGKQPLLQQAVHLAGTCRVAAEKGDKEERAHRETSGQAKHLLETYPILKLRTLLRRDEGTRGQSSSSSLSQTKIRDEKRVWGLDQGMQHICDNLQGGPEAHD